jgi:hypothetical protein
MCHGRWLIAGAVLLYHKEVGVRMEGVLSVFQDLVTFSHPVICMLEVSPRGVRLMISH